MSLTFILTDGHLEFIGIGSLTPNALKDIYILISTTDFQVVACDDGNNERCLISFFLFLIHILAIKSQQLLHLGRQEQVTATFTSRTTRTSHSDFYI